MKSADIDIIIYNLKTNKKLFTVRYITISFFKKRIFDE